MLGGIDLIPKIIHYCWFGRGPKSELHKKCIDSWRKFCPDYRIIEWNEENYDVNKIPYIRDAYKEKKWGFVSDYARLDIVYEYGGIYLDTDVELMKPLDELLNNSCYFGIEKGTNEINTGIGFGAEKANDHIKELMDLYEKLSFYKKNGEIDVTPCTVYTTDFFRKYGYVKEDRLQNIDNITVYPTEFFCPMDYETRRIHYSDKTISIHLFDASWYSDDDRYIYEMGVKIRQILPGILAKPVHFVGGYCYRAKCYAKEGKLLYIIKKRLKELKKEKYE